MTVLPSKADIVPGLGGVSSVPRPEVPNQPRYFSKLRTDSIKAFLP